MDQIRNFSIIAHIDHGKSTLADRMLELTGTVEKRKMKEQFLDNLELERERGITIKLQTVRMNWNVKSEAGKEPFVLNLIDTPGHVDFSYEVSRALAACEGAVLLVDATQGIQAQTISHALKALDLGLTLIPVVNKIDLPSAQPQKTAKELVDTFGFKEDEIICVSGKTGKGVEELLDRIAAEIPAPKGDPKKPLTALVFDSFYDSHKGVVALVRIFDGELSDPKTPLFLKGSKTDFLVMEWGYLNPDQTAVDKLGTGEVGYIATGLKSIRDVHVGDTITLAPPAEQGETLPGYKPPTPMVYASMFPIDSADWNPFREAFEKLTLNDAAVQFNPIHHPALGAGYRCGFLGLLHMDVVRERLEREYDLAVLVASPGVTYKVDLTDGSEVTIDEADALPIREKIVSIKEPYVIAEIITPPENLGDIMKLLHEKRGTILETNQYANLVVKTEIPLAELITDTFDRLKAISHGYASIDYEFTDFRPNDIVRLDFLVNHEAITPLSTLVHSSKAVEIGKKVAAILKEVVPRHQFPIPIQAAIGGKVIARETIPAYRKDVLAGMYGGDITRKKKKLEKQKKGKEKLRKFGSVELPAEAFLAAVAGKAPEKKKKE